MPEYLAPGVVVEEIERGPQPIQAAATSTAAFLGETERGPLSPRLVTSYGEYLRTYGNVLEHSQYLPYAVKAFFDNGGRRCYIARIVGQGAGVAELKMAGMTIKAIGPGPAYTRVWIRIFPGTALGVNNESIGFRLQVNYWTDASTQITDPTLGDQTHPSWTIVEDFDNLSVDPASISYFEKRVNNGNSSYIDIAPQDIEHPVPLPSGEFSARLASHVNAGRYPVASDYVGTHSNPALRAGLSALELDEFADVAIVYAPNADISTAKCVIAHCEHTASRFAVVDCPRGVIDERQLKPKDELTASPYAAYYYPWLWINDPNSGARFLVPPGGAVCGIYARMDNTRGVFKAPANQSVVGAIDMEVEVSHATQEMLNSRSVNIIRQFPGRGIQVWGARTLSSDPVWRYISVRRGVIFLEQSILTSTQWVIFEPNNHTLWVRVHQAISQFLQSQWLAGALSGTTQQEAFYVAVGRRTMTEDDILNGRLIVEIGIAPIRPAEFVILRINQKTIESN